MVQPARTSGDRTEQAETSTRGKSVLSGEKSHNNDSDHTAREVCNTLKVDACYH